MGRFTIFLKILLRKDYIDGSTGVYNFRFFGKIKSLNWPAIFSVFFYFLWYYSLSKGFCLFQPLAMRELNRPIFFSRKKLIKNLPLPPRAWESGKKKSFWKNLLSSAVTIRGWCVPGVMGKKIIFSVLVLFLRWYFLGGVERKREWDCVRFGSRAVENATQIVFLTRDLPSQA